ncbi:MAG: hypothetical protein KDE08_09550 [Rhodobacteraceae bacterium]|nr:hypothetical protein [Paracoccaceae bacterium]
MTIGNDRDDIDVIVDRILANPERANELKATLRTHIVKENTRPEIYRRPAPQAQMADADMFWDNVPI